MKLKFYSVPRTEFIPRNIEDAFLITSGADDYHDGGGGYYGESDLNDNDFVY